MKREIEKARDYVYETHYLYGAANLPSWARSGTTGGAIARTSYTFRSFTHNYVLTMIRSLKGPDGKIALDVVGRSLAYLFLFGGLFDKGQRVLEAFSRDDILRAIEAGSPAFIENLFKAYRMYEEGATTPRGKIIYDGEGKPIQLGLREAVGQAAGFRPERVARAGMEKRSFGNVEGHYREKRDNLYAKYRLAHTEEERRNVLKQIERYNLEVMKYLGAIPRITRDSLKQTGRQRPDKAFMRFEQAYVQ